MKRLSDRPILLIWLLAVVLPPLLVISAFGWEGSEVNVPGLGLGLSTLVLPIAMGVAFIGATTGFWIIRQRRRGDSSKSVLLLAWVWGLTWWIISIAAHAAAQGQVLIGGAIEPEALALFLCAAITCALVWHITRLRESLILAAFGGISLVALTLSLLTWPLLVYGGLAYWATGARRPFRPGICATCGYALKGLPSDAVCPECGNSPVQREGGKEREERSV